MYAGVIVLDGNRARFSAPDWKSLLAIKVLRARLRDVLTRSFRMPGRLLTAQQEKWLDVWQRIFTAQQDLGVGGGNGGSSGAATASGGAGGNRA